MGEDSLLYTVLFYFRFLTSILMIETKAEDASKPSDFIAKSTVKSLLCFLHKKGIKALLLLCFYTFSSYTNLLYFDSLHFTVIQPLNVPTSAPASTSVG